MKYEAEFKKKGKVLITYDYSDDCVLLRYDIEDCYFVECPPNRLTTAIDELEGYACAELRRAYKFDPKWAVVATKKETPMGELILTIRKL